MRTPNLTQINIDRQVHRRFKAATAMRGQTMKEVIEKLLLDYASQVLNGKSKVGLSPNTKATIFDRVNSN